jgi:hypothetical protein
MNRSLYAQIFLFEPFFAFLNAASCPTFPSMSYEAAFKTAKKSTKNKNLSIKGSIHAKSTP